MSKKLTETQIQELLKSAQIQTRSVLRDIDYHVYKVHIDKQGLMFIDAVNVDTQDKIRVLVIYCTIQDILIYDVYIFYNGEYIEIRYSVKSIENLNSIVKTLINKHRDKFVHK